MVVGWYEIWLKRRLPRCASVILDQRRIFILPTRHGVYFCLMLLAIFIGGINYGNSLLLALSFLLTSLFIVSILHTFRNLSGLKIVAGKTEPTFAGGEAVFRLNLVRQERRSHESIGLYWDGADPQQVDLIDVGEQSVSMLVPVPRRGRFHPSWLQVETRYPLGLLRAWSRVDLDQHCLVYPRPEETGKKWVHQHDGEQGEILSHEGSDDFDGLRPYHPGDSPRHIAWKSYARGGELYTKRFVGHRQSEQWLDWAAFPSLGVEKRLSALCYWVLKLSEQERCFGLKIPGTRLEPASGTGHEQACLKALALFGVEEG